jgi:hypothetical protein
MPRGAFRRLRRLNRIVREHLRRQQLCDPAQPVAQPGTKDPPNVTASKWNRYAPGNVVKTGEDQRELGPWPPGRFSGRIPPRRPSAAGAPTARGGQPMPGRAASPAACRRVSGAWGIGLAFVPGRGRAVAMAATLSTSRMFVNGRLRTDPTLQSPFGPGGRAQIAGNLEGGSCRQKWRIR